MKRIASPILLLVQLSACSQTHVDIKAPPPGIAKVQIELDDAQCASESQYRGPLVLRPFNSGSSEEKYKACLIRRGYTVAD